MTLTQRQKTWTYGALMLGAGGVIWGMAMAILLDAIEPSGSRQNVVAACDRAVHSLFTTTDALELQRAEIIIRELNCGIRKRAPQPVTSL